MSFYSCLALVHNYVGCLQSLDRIFQFENFAQTKKRVMSNDTEDSAALVSAYSYLLYTTLHIYCTLHCTYTVHYTAHILYTTLHIYCTLHCTYTVHYTAHILYTTLHIYCTLHCTYTVHYTAHILYTTLHIYCTLHCTYTVHYTAHILYFLKVLYLTRKTQTRLHALINHPRIEHIDDFACVYLCSFACVRLRVLFAIDRVRVRACVREHVRI